MYPKGLHAKQQIAGGAAESSMGRSSWKKHCGTRPGQKDRWVLSKNFKGEEVFFLTKWFLEVPCHISSSSSSSSSSYHYIDVEDHAIIHIDTHLQSYRLYRSQ